jgi:hypothetical protein
MATITAAVGRCVRPHAEPDGQLVQADADPQRDKGQPVTAGQAVSLLLLVLVTGQQHPGTDADHRGRGQVVRDLPDAAGQGRVPISVRALTLAAMIASDDLSVHERNLVPQA